ncbi:hypothetical protein [Lutibacter sp. B1]|jgi:uncharacterized protein YxeA|uniref:hypothetical protein n=1 Tax=Lutibacter sp. B1 TaxID=2725996 RepID=UPI00145711D9|nr:hypothetical protein [Lutibacter sp. B1]NLP57269.1 hypothetical protein [Lutibacter sp. B1]
MKFVLSTILILVVGMIGVGFYLKNSGDTNGEIIIGVAVLIIAFILMPLFIFHRYKNKDLSSFEIKNFRERIKEHEEGKSDKD